MSDSDSSSEDEDLFQMGQVRNPKATQHCLEDEDCADAIPHYEKPNYAAAMEYWNTLLPRRIKDPSQPSGYRQALVGELFDENGEPAELYDFFKTDSGALDEFGIGMSLYFRTLKMMGIVCFVCALILLVSVEENKKNQHNDGWGGGIEDVEDTIGTCEVSYDSLRDEYIFDRNTTDAKLATQWNLLGSAYGATPQSLSFNKQGVADLVMFSICLVMMLLASRLEKKEVEAIDIAQQTTQDYSVVVKNPPPDVRSEKEYYEFFSKFGEVVTLTVSLRNGGLIKAIADRKMLLMKVESMREREALNPPNPEQECTLADRVTSLLGMDLASCEAKLEKMDAEILAMSNCDYNPWRIFVSFNKEEEQLRCLDHLATNNDLEYLNFFNWLHLEEDKAPEHQFHGQTLIVAQAPEPTDVIYDHTHRKKAEVYLRLLMSYSLTGFAIFLVMLIITSLQNTKGRFAQIIVALFISWMNAGLPVGIRLLTQIVEAHSSETGSQRSVLTKLIIARCMNSAVLIYVLTPWHEQFSLENMRQIQVIMLSDCFVAPFIRFLNPWDVFKRRFIAPVVFGKSQAGYNSQFQGTKWTLAERYTDALKSVFTGFFFAVPLPTGLFITSLTLMSTYMVDKLCLMRMWERKPTIDHSLAKLSRYFLITTLWTHLFISLKYFANWPYSYGGLPEETSCDFNCEECPDRVDDVSCNFFFFFCGPTRNYMTVSQYTTVYVFLVLALLIGGLIVFYFLLFRTTKKLIGRVLAQKKEDTSDPSDIPLREVFGAPAYVPTIKLKQMTAPFVFSDINNLPIRFSPVRQNAGWDETVDPKNFSLVCPSFYPQVSAVHFKGMFSTTTFYEAKDIFSNLVHGEDESSDDGSLDSNEEKSECDAPSGLGADHRISEEDFNTSSFMDTDSLPSGWERRITTDGRIFFVDHNEMKITHIAPPVVMAGAGTSFRTLAQGFSSKLSRQDSSPKTVSKRIQAYAKNSKSKGSFQGHPAQLPQGWERRMTDTGREYFVDHNSRENHWTLPTHLLDDTGRAPPHSSLLPLAIEEVQV